MARGHLDHRGSGRPGSPSPVVELRPVSLPAIVAKTKNTLEHAKKHQGQTKKQT